MFYYVFDVFDLLYFRNCLSLIQYYHQTELQKEKVQAEREKVKTEQEKTKAKVAEAKLSVFQQFCAPGTIPPRNAASTSDDEMKLNCSEGVKNTVSTSGIKCRFMEAS